MQRVIHLALYGSIEHTRNEDLIWDLYQTEPLARLRDISLSSIPSRFAPHGTAAGRFQHSVGVSYLARRLCDMRKGLKPYRDLLSAAALTHDIGSPPFSHISELFFYDLAGRTHEQQTAMLLAPGTELHELLSFYEVDPAAVVDIINGQHHPLGPLVAGSIDLDNADNSLHLLWSLGYSDYVPYHPLKLIEAFQFRGGQVTLDSAYLSEILGWAEVRRTLYRLLHSEPNLSSSTMLYRALEYAYASDALTAEFFELGESDALQHLRDASGDESREIVESMIRWRHYPLVHEQASMVEDPRITALYDDWEARKRFADTLADELEMPRERIAVYVGRDRGEKTIKLPFTGPQADPAAALFADRHGEQRLAVFAHKSARERHEHDEYGRLTVLPDLIEELLEEIPNTARIGGHVFF